MIPPRLECFCVIGPDAPYGRPAMCMQGKWAVMPREGVSTDASFRCCRKVARGYSGELCAADFNTSNSHTLPGSRSRYLCHWIISTSRGITTGEGRIFSGNALL